MTSIAERLRSPRRRRAVAWAAASCVAALVAVALSAGGPAADASAATKAAPPPPALTVETVSPRLVTMARTVSASGSVAARDELLVGSDAAGVRLLELHADEGTVVRRGQLLARGDDALLLAQLAQQQALVRQAGAERDLAQANLARAESVQDSGVYSVEALQTRRSAAAAAAARFDLAQAQQRELELRLQRTRVHAPADGVVSRRSATVGAVVQPGQELFRIIRDQALEWRAELPDHALAAVRPGAAVRVRLDDTQVVDGRVRLVAPTVDARTRNGIVHVSLPPGTPLKAGGHAQGEIELGSAALWTLPESVLLSRDGHSFVYLVGDHGVARATRVHTGVRQRGLVEVRGLSPDAQVVATGAGFVKDGERVRVATTREGARS